ncbi:MAG: metal ABC transporter ATP-binding protein [Treponemataceae bacterium]
MPLFTCTNLSMAYDHNIILQNINFSVNEGSFISIIGNNGTGKTTLLHTVLQLKNPISGTIVFDKSCRKNEIGYVPQTTTMQNNFPASVWEVVLSGRINQHRFSPFFSKADKEIAQENLERLNIQDLKNKSYQELSVGHQQKVLLARALCVTKKLLFLDEPASSLDPVAKYELYELIHMLHQTQKITIIMISHDIEAVKKYSTHLLELVKNTAVFSVVNANAQEAE